MIKSLEIKMVGADGLSFYQHKLETHTPLSDNEQHINLVITGGVFYA
jgi:hypothetical protein